MSYSPPVSCNKRPIEVIEEIVSIRNGLLSPELVIFGLHPALCSHLKGAWCKACLGADRRWVNCPSSITLCARFGLGVLDTKRTSDLLMMGTGLNLLLTVYLHEIHKPAAPSLTAQPDHGVRAVLAVWSLASGRLDASPFGDALKTDCR